MSDTATDTPRYVVMFTPIGWQLIDTGETPDDEPREIKTYFHSEHAEAKAHAAKLNAEVK